MFDAAEWPSVAHDVKLTDSDVGVKAEVIGLSRAWFLTLGVYDRVGAATARTKEEAKRKLEDKIDAYFLERRKAEVASG
jgi:hypothetical protein